MKAIDLNVTNWIVRFEAEGKDASGAPTRVAAEGRLDDIGSNHRTIKESGIGNQDSAQGQVSACFLAHA